jgi:hypothetical protein
MIWQKYWTLKGMNSTKKSKGQDIKQKIILKKFEKNLKEI